MSRRRCLARCGLLFILAGAAASDAVGLAVPPERADADFGPVEREVRSAYSHIRVRRKGSLRSLMFVRNSGEEAAESMVDLNRPHELVFDYTKFMFLSYLFRPAPEKVLVVGLGGGSMVHFLKHYDPRVAIDVVEIDPAIIQIAEKNFGVYNGGKLKIIADDAVGYLATTASRYDVIYLDAFLKPTAETDRNGVPLRLKTVPFYNQLQRALGPNGVAVFNLNPSARIWDDVRAIGRAFPQAYVFRLPRSQGLVVVASLSKDRLQLPALRRMAAELDTRFKATFSFREMAARLVR